MRLSLIRTIFCLGLLAPLMSQAQIGNCENISDPDQRIMCMARSKKDVKICNGMSTSDAVHFCHAVSTGNSYPCEKITGNRSHCLASVREFQRKSSSGS
jgi:hypothetical protein